MGRLSVYNPATGDLVSDKVPLAGEEDVDLAVKAANEAFAADSPWRTMDNNDRRDVLMKFADLLDRDREHLAYLTRITLGAPYKAFGSGEIGTTIQNFRFKPLIT
jgi:acyl-CoA reductase-like NAD-dependent aldehyde dehydrogenase